MKRRVFIALLGGAAAWPIGTRAQQASMPTIPIVFTSGDDPDRLTTVLRHREAVTRIE